MHRLVCLIVLIFAVNMSDVIADVVPVDLLNQSGAFEITDSLSLWDARYSGNDIDLNASDMWSWGSPGSRTGYNIPTDNDTLGSGWSRATSPLINPVKNIVYKLVSGGVNGSKCQYFAIKDMTDNGEAILLYRIPLGATGKNIRIGDEVTFKLDHIRMSDYDGIIVTCRLRVRPSDETSTWTTQVLPKSQTAFSSQLKARITDLSSTLTVEIMIAVDQGTKGHTPGIYVDGAHVYVKRSGDTVNQTAEIPALRNRAIKTIKMFYSSLTHDEYFVANNYDYVVMSDLSDSHPYSAIAAMKAINPNIKVYLYKSANVVLNNNGGKDSYFGTSPNGFGYVESTHPEWLCKNGTGIAGYVNDCGYNNIYYAKCANAAYQDAWCSGLLKKLGNPKVDGVFIDDAVALQRYPQGSAVPIKRPDVTCSDIQQFLHYVVARLRNSSLDVIQNAASAHLTSGIGPVYFNPFWKPVAPYNSADYTTNTPALVPHMFQEWAFFQLTGPIVNGTTTTYTGNYYDSKYWKQCIDDMDQIKTWNTDTTSRSLPSNQKRYLHMLVLGIDNTETDPAYGADGWLNFGLCSYLIGQNDWTTFGCGMRNNYTADMDYSITKKLGSPTGNHAAYNGDEYMRFRLYEHTSDGGQGGVVVVNANTTLRTYKLGFTALDNGNIIPSGTTITLPPHTGRIYLNVTPSGTGSNITVNIAVPTSSVKPGQIVTITVSYTNKGTTDANNVLVQAIVPTELKYITGSASDGSYNSTTNMVSWTISKVGAGQSGTKTFKAQVN